MTDQTEITKKMHELVKEHIKGKKEEFVPGETVITTGLAVYDDKELNAVIDSLLTGWFGLGRKGKEFEDLFSEYVTNKHTTLVNSGSSANLLALNGIKNNLKLVGGEIITPACTFPTTLNPIIQLGFKPAFVDVDKTLNVSVEGIKSAVNKNTKGIIVPHTMGNPCEIDTIMDIADDNGLFVIEDACDALGSKLNNKACGSFGTASTFSFYPAHHISLGEGGAISTNDDKLNRVIHSLRDWGRDCWCTTDEKNLNGACNKRFDYKIKDIPYDHRYVFSQIGYNMKPLELQAAMGIEQLEKIDEFNKVRKRNFRIYCEEFSAFKEFELPEINDKADPVFFGLPIMIKDSKIKRQELIKFLNDNKIATRLLFCGNVLYQPAYQGIEHVKYQDLAYTDEIMKNGFWIGLHQGVNEEMIKYIISKFRQFLA